MTSRLAIFNPGDVLETGQRIFGKDVANFQLFQGLVRHGGFERVDFLMSNPVPPERLVEALDVGGPGSAPVGASHLLDVTTATRAGTLLRGSVFLEEPAWLRRRIAGDTAYSLIGLIHTIAPPATRHDIAMASVAPIQPWDAIVCTSPAVQAAMAAMFEEWEDYLCERFEGTRRTRPQLPLIPLAVDTGRFAAAADRGDARARMREELEAGDEDIVLAWVGRLSFFEKAFPQSMMRAAQEASEATGRKVHLAMAGWFPADSHRPMYESAARAYAPDVAFHIVDGRDGAKVDALWAACDIFISLVDNIQETFGLAPVEAMACGKPVVVSDWDGYRYTVVDGEQGFLIPTLVGPPNLLGNLQDQHAAELKNYQQYVGTIAQHSAVDIGAAARALVALIESPELRQRMGEAGRRRAQSRFDYRVVAPMFATLAAELEAIRRATPTMPARSARPVKGDPLHDFAGFASEVLGPGMSFALRPGSAGDLARSMSLDLDRFARNFRASEAETRTLLELLGAAPATSTPALLSAFPPEAHRRVLLTLLWLAKNGTVEWRSAP